MGSKGSQTVTTNQQQQYTPAPAVGGAGTQALTAAQTAAGAPFQQPVAPVAGFDPMQYLGFGETLAAQGMAQPYFQAGANYLQGSAAPVTGQDVAQYYNPMAANVTAQMQNIFGQQMREATGQATQQAGGVGADRIGVAQANLANQQGLAAGQTYSQLYQQALQAAEQQKQMMAGAGYGLGQMGPAAQAAQLQGIQALLGVGGQQQQLTQAQMNALYQNELARIAYPFQTAQYLAGITGGLAPAMGGKTTGQATTTYPSPSPLAQLLGLGVAGAGIYGGLGGSFSNPFASPTSLSPGTVGGTGGGLGGFYQSGGSIDDYGKLATRAYRKELGDMLPAAESGNPIAEELISDIGGSLPMQTGGNPMGGFNLPSMPQMPNVNMPQMPQLPQMPSMPQTATPQMPQMPTMPQMPSTQMAMPQMPTMPAPPTQAVNPFQPPQQLPQQQTPTMPPPQFMRDMNTWRNDADSWRNRAQQFAPQAMQQMPQWLTSQLGNFPSQMSGMKGSMMNRPYQSGGEVGQQDQPLPFPGASVPKVGGVSPIPYISLPMGSGEGHNRLTLQPQSPAMPGQQGGSSGLNQAIGTGLKVAEMAAMFAARGGGVSPFDVGQPFQDGGPSFAERFTGDQAGNWPAVDPNAPGFGSLPAAKQGMIQAIKPPPDTGDTGDETVDISAAKRALPSPMGAPAGLPQSQLPYPDATQRDWGQRAIRFPWLALVEAGAKMAQTRGPIGSVIGAGLEAGAGTLAGQRKALQSEEDINLKAQHLAQQAQIHLDEYTRMKPYQTAEVGLRQQALEQTKYTPVNLEITDEKGEPKTIAARFNPKTGTYEDTEGNPVAGRLIARQTGAESQTSMAHEAFQAAKDRFGDYSLDPNKTINEERVRRGLKPRSDLGVSKETAIPDPGEGHRKTGMWYIVNGIPKQWI